MISWIITTNHGLRSIQLGGNPFLSNATGRDTVVTALKSQPDLLNDCVWDTSVRIKPALDTVEKKFQALPTRMRYAAMKPLHLQWFECIRSGSVVQMNKFLKNNGKNFDPAVLHPEGFNAVHVAAANGYSKVLKELLKVSDATTSAV